VWASALPARLAWVATGLALMVAARQALRIREPWPWLGIALYGAMAIAVFAACFHAERPDKTPLSGLRLGLGRLGWRGPLLLFALACTVIQLEVLQAQMRPGLVVVLGLWIAAIVAYVVAMWDAPAASLRLPRDGLLDAAALLTLALALRLWHLDSIPWVFGGDEAGFSLEGIKAGRGAVLTPFGTGLLGQPNPTFLYQGLAFTALDILRLEPTIFASRLPWALLGALTISVLYTVVRVVHGRGAALVAAFLLATMAYHIHYSRLALNNAADPLFLTLGMLALTQAEMSRSRLAWTLVGVCAGLGMYFYTGGLGHWLILALAIACLARLDPRGFWRYHRLGLICLAGAAIVAIGPLAQYAAINPDNFTDAIKRSSVFHTGYLREETARRGISELEFFVDQARAALGSFTVTSDRSAFYGAGGGPLLDRASATLFLLGTLAALVRFRDWRWMVFPLWWGSAVLLPSILSVNPPSSQRLLGAAPAAAALAALGVVAVARLVQRRLPGSLHRPAAALVAVGLGAIAVANAQFYFGQYTPVIGYGHGNEILSTAAGIYLRDSSSPGVRLYWYGAPRVYAGYAPLRFLAPCVDRIDVPPQVTLEKLRELVRPANNELHMFLPERARELELVRQIEPRGTVRELRKPGFDEVMVVVYQPSRASRAPLRRDGGAIDRAAADCEY
jgi:hypothetical protein